jgi:hypothetical protein
MVSVFEMVEVKGNQRFGNTWQNDPSCVSLLHSDGSVEGIFK